MENETILVKITLSNNFGLFSIDEEDHLSPVWTRIKLFARSRGIDCDETDLTFRVAWADTLTIIRELGTRRLQTSLNFRFLPEGEAKEKTVEFAKQFKKTKLQRQSLTNDTSVEHIQENLAKFGFTKRTLKPFQLRDVRHLLSLENGANFSVPGAGKTTVTFAIHILTRTPGQSLLVVCPKAATQAWKDIVLDCMDVNAPLNGSEPFNVLTGNKNDIIDALYSGGSRFIISYDLIVRHQSIFAEYLSRHSCHLVLDESHRMKAGWQSQRGTFFLNISSLPIRRDILTGTPMPQGASDIESQLDFLWPGYGLGLEVVQGTSPRVVLGNLYVRTTKKELGLPEKKHHFRDVGMKPGQLALYSIVRNEFVRDFSRLRNRNLGTSEILKARRSVMRLLQLSVNPMLALAAMSSDGLEISSGLIDTVMEEGNSQKLEEIMDHARELAHQGQKCVIWTIFTNTIYSLSSALADLNPVFIHGGVKSGLETDPESREGRIKRFHMDSTCMVLIANPAAAGEGISLHTVCHNALYVDRSYVSTHYLQSIDRIHRLGLPIGQETNIYIYRSKAPSEIGSIDLSVSRRLGEKIRNMQILLDDYDLHQMALNEEEADDPIDYDIDLHDVCDLIDELENKTTASTEYI